MQGNLGHLQREPQGDIWAMSCGQPEAREEALRHLFSLVCGEYCHSSSLSHVSSLPPWVVGLPHLTDVRDTISVTGFGSQRGRKSNPGFSCLTSSPGAFWFWGAGMWPRVPSLHLGCLRPRGRGVLTLPSCSCCCFWWAGSHPLLSQPRCPHVPQPPAS